jgi:hypothetical protein
MEKLPPTPQTNALNRNLREACRDEYMYSEMLAFAQMLERQRNELQDIKRKHEENELRMAHEIDQLRAALLAMHEFYREYRISVSLLKQVEAALQIVS